MLPKLDGVEVCKILKNKRKTWDVPIIMLTALGTIEAIEEAFAAGANDYLLKPFEYSRLLDKAKKFLAN